MNRTVAYLLIFMTTLSGSAFAKEKRYLTGQADDVKPKLAGPILILGGGSNNDTEGFQWTVNKLRDPDETAKLDVVVIGFSGADEWNQFIYDLDGVDSVESLIIRNRKDANSDAVNKTIRDAEIIYFAGGDQCNYVRNLKSTEVQKSVEHVYHKGGAIGGSSAGLAIQGSAVYDACTKDSAYSPQSLANPYYADISFTNDFFRWPSMEGTITDTHFAQRDRMGRLLAFLARQIKDEKCDSILGVGVNEETTVVVDRDGLARVMGDGPAYFILADHEPELCNEGIPLTYSNFKTWKVPRKGTFDLKKRAAPGQYSINVEKGRITSDPY